MDVESTDDASSSNVRTAARAICGNLEIMDNIIGFLYERGEDNKNPLSPSDSSKKNLLAACLVSKAFFLDPALTILWRHLDSLWPVLCLFPTFHEDDQSGKWSLMGTVHKDHLQRVPFYSRRIRSIRIHSPQTTGITDTLTILSSRMQPLQPFLPLTQLTVRILPAKNILNPILFIMPLTLTNIDITGISLASRVAVASLLQHLSSDCKSLKRLSLTGSLDNAFLSNLLACTSLRSLTLTSSETVFSADYLRDLSGSLPFLETLSLKLLQSDSDFNVISTSFPPAIFASLLNLTLTGDLPSISGILSTLQAPQLHGITLSFSSQISLDTPDAATFATCVSQVAKINGLEGRGNLRAVKIAHTNRSTCITMSAFDKLDALRATIQILHLEPNHLFMELQKECKNPLETKLIYPNLVDLRLPFKTPRWPDAAKYSLAVLESVVRFCPNLKTFHVSIGAYDEDTMKSRNTPVHGLQTLQTLVFHHLPSCDFSITIAVAFARYLNYLFPMLSSALYWEDVSEDIEEWWTGVQEMLKMCQGKENAGRLAINNV